MKTLVEFLIKATELFISLVAKLLPHVNHLEAWENDDHTEDIYQAGIFRVEIRSGRDLALGHKLYVKRFSIETMRFAHAYWKSVEITHRGKLLVGADNFEEKITVYTRRVDASNEVYFQYISDYDYNKALVDKISGDIYEIEDTLDYTIQF